jgi:hypothetical protein
VISLVVIVLLAGLLYIAFSWFRWCRKRVGDANELEWLDELAEEHLAGSHDHTRQLQWLIRVIEKNHPPSPSLRDRLDGVRRIIWEREEDHRARVKKNPSRSRGLKVSQVVSRPSEQRHAGRKLT